MLFSPSAAVFLAILLSAAAALAQAPPPLPVSENGTQFLVFFRSQPIGREEVLVLRVARGWVVRGSSRLGPPIDITSRVAEINYDAQWRPKSLLVDGVVRGQDVTLKTTFNGTKASNVLAVQGAPQSKVDDVSADAIVLPNTFLGSYAALAMRLLGKTAGAELRAYIAPQAEVTIRVTGAVPEGISTPRGTIQSTHYAMTLVNPPPAGELAVNLWADPEGRLLRMNIPAQQVEMAREDIASAASRTSAFSNPGDESVTIPSLGFNLAGTITKPQSDKPLPAVILVAAAGSADRDETVAGIPVFGHIARDLAAAGFVVVRFDKRGVGQSGGRAESATIADYAEDGRQVLLRLEKRKDVDKNRIALVGHSEGASAAMLAAGRERGKVAALVLLAGPSASGNEIVLEQQKLLLSSLPIDDAQRAERQALQERSTRAVIKGTGWTDLPEQARRAADTPWFYSFLTFNPEKAMSDTRQPVLVVQGELDTQVLPAHADKLAAFARAKGHQGAGRRRESPGREPPAGAGEDWRRNGCASLGSGAAVSPKVTGAIAAFLSKAMQE
ncbi:MAG: alpha/beta fold hydrolase [Hymenobacter sp.]